MNTRYSQHAARRYLSHYLKSAGIAAIVGGAFCHNISTAQAAPATTTATAPVYPTGLTNIAASANGGRVLEASSTMNNAPDFKASNLIDGRAYNAASKSGTAGWASNKFDPVNMDYVTIGFADNAVKRIGKIVLNPASATTPERWAKDVEVQVSTDTVEGPYRAVAQLTLRRAAERQDFLILPAPARFVRLRFRSNWGSDQVVSLGEVEIYEAVNQNDPVGQLIARLEGAVNELKRYQETQAEIGDSGGARTASTSKRSSVPKNVAAPRNRAQANKAAPLEIASATNVSAALKLLPNAPANTLTAGRATSSAKTATTNTPRGTTVTKSSAQRLAQATDGTTATTPAASAAITGSEPGPTAASASAVAPRVVAGNIAAAANGGKIMGVSSIFSNDPLFGPETLIDSQNYSLRDDKGSFGWASEGFAPGQQFVTLGFRDDRSHLIGKIVLNPSSNQASLRWASRVDVQVTNGSAKSGPWRTVSTINIRQEPTNQDFSIRPVEAKYVRFVFTANGPGNPLTQADPNVSSDRAVSLGEIEIYEPNVGSGDLDAIVGRFTGVLNDLKRIHEQNDKAAATAAS